jgi:hypothetical protein
MPMTVELTLKRPHAGQRELIDNAARFNVVQCGRRFGKTTLGEILASKAVLDGCPVGWFAPTYKYLTEPMLSLTSRLRPIKRSFNKIDQRFEAMTDGVIDFWSLVDMDSGRGRKYKLVIIDEGSVVRDLQRVWTETIRPMLTDFRGDAWFLGTPRGTRRYFHTLFNRGEQHQKNWKSWRRGTIDNKYIHPEEIEEARQEYEQAGLTHIFEQEFLGIPADDGGNPFGLKAIRDCIRDGLSTKTPVAFGVDLAKSQDWTWIVGLDEHANVCVSERFQVDWGQTRTRVLAQVNGWPALVDSTGVGDPIVEDLHRVRPNINGFKFSATSKQQIMEGLASGIQQNRIRFPDGLLVNELESFQYEYRRNGGIKYEAPAGLHDDGVCALALAYQQLTNLNRNPLTVRMIGGDVKEDWKPW